MARNAFIHGRLFGKNWTPPEDQDSLTALKEVERLAEELFDEYASDFIDGFSASVLERNL